MRGDGAEIVRFELHDLGDAAVGGTAVTIYGGGDAVEGDGEDAVVPALGA